MLSYSKIFLIGLFILFLGVIVNCKHSTSAGQSCYLPSKHIKQNSHVKIFLHVDQLFSATQQIAIANSAFMWTNATGGQVEFEILSHKVTKKEASWHENNGCNSHVSVMKFSSSDEDVVELETQFRETKDKNEGEFQLLGFTKKRCDNSIIGLISNRLDDSDMKQVMSHELGHYLDVPHIKIPDDSSRRALMYPYIDKKHSSPCLTMLDLEKFCQLNGCYSERLRPCEQ